MTVSAFPRLFSPFEIKGLEIRNRVFSTGHDTELPKGGLVSDALVAYQRARARGGAGLIVIQVVGVHETARYTSDLLMGTEDACIGPFRTLFEAIHGEGAKVFAQLFHPGRELMGRPEGVVQAAYAPSFSPSERFRVAPRPMSRSLIGEIIEGYGAAARRIAEAGADGVEIVGSHGYLPAQFLNPNVNLRDDEYGGSLENRLRFVREAIAAIRRQVPEGFIVGLRFSGDEKDPDGLDESQTLAAGRALAPELDYLNVIAGTSAAPGGAVHIVPPMSIEHGYVAPFAQTLKQATGRPVFVAGRINQPQIAEQILSQGAADMCGMTRAMICDPEMPNKARIGKADDIRACIGCNQACIGHFQLGLPISCIQHPETGRELVYDRIVPAARRKSVMVVGGGPAGMKAAAVAAARGHAVTLHEKSGRLGGQALLAQLLPRRAEFGGIATNLEREMELAGVTVRRRSEVTPDVVREEAPDALIVACGSEIRTPPIEAGEGVSVVHAADILAGRASTGARVVVYDWLADWVGSGIAEKLAGEGAHVRLAVNGFCAMANIQNYVRDDAIARLHRLGVEVLPFMRLYGCEGGTVYFLHTTAQEPIVLEDVDTVVLACPNAPVDPLSEALRGEVPEIHVIGDALSARTAEEAVYEGLKAAWSL